MELKERIKQEPNSILVLQGVQCKVYLYYRVYSVQCTYITGCTVYSVLIPHGVQSIVYLYYRLYSVQFTYTEGCTMYYTYTTGCIICSVLILQGVQFTILILQGVQCVVCLYYRVYRGQILYYMVYSVKCTYTTGFTEDSILILQSAGCSILILQGVQCVVYLYYRVYSVQCTYTRGCTVYYTYTTGCIQCVVYLCKIYLYYEEQNQKIFNFCLKILGLLEYYLFKPLEDLIPFPTLITLHSTHTLTWEQKFITFPPLPFTKSPPYILRSRAEDCLFIFFCPETKMKHFQNGKS